MFLGLIPMDRDQTPRQETQVSYDLPESEKVLIVVPQG
jgi:hypothetical protein